MKTLTSIFFLLTGIIGFSLIFPQKITFIDNIRLSLESVFLKKVCNNLVGREYFDEWDNPIEGPTDISFSDTKPYRDLLIPGDVIFTSSRRYVGNTLIPGKWKHSAIYIGTKKKLLMTFGESNNLNNSLEKYFVKGDEELIIDSSLEGVKIRKFYKLSRLKKVSYLQSIVAFRIEESISKRNKLINSSLRQIGKKYDFDWLSYNDDSIYCSELLFRSFDAIGICVDQQRRIINREIFIPDDIVRFIVNKGISEGTFSFLFCIKKNKQIFELSVEKVL